MLFPATGKAFRKGAVRPLAVSLLGAERAIKKKGVQRVEPFGKINAWSKWWKIACNLPYLVWQIKNMTFQERVERWQV